MDSGFPVSLLKAANARRWLAFARAYVEARWPHAAAKPREGLTDTMTAVTIVLVKTCRGVLLLRSCGRSSANTSSFRTIGARNWGRLGGGAEVAGSGVASHH